MTEGPPTLYIFPHAGGSAEYYVPFAKAFSSDIKRIAVRYPGRAGTHDLGSFTSISDLADKVCRMVPPPDPSGEKVAFCSSKVIAALEGFARSNLRVNDNAADKYGIKMSTYVSGQGTVNIVHHRDWQDSSVYGGYAFLVDMSSVKERPLRPTRLKENVQAPDYDGFKDEYISEWSLQVTHERKHSLLTGVT